VFDCANLLVPQDDGLMGVKLADPELHNIRGGLTARDLSTIDHQVGHNDLTIVGAFCLQLGSI